MLLASGYALRLPLSWFMGSLDFLSSKPTSKAGLESGPRVLCGHAKGQVSSISLPNFVLKKYWHALERCKAGRKLHVGCAGALVLLSVARGVEGTGERGKHVVCFLFLPLQVQTLCCAGHDGIYVLGAENGTLQLWQRDGTVDSL